MSGVFDNNLAVNILLKEGLLIWSHSSISTFI